MSKSNPRKGYLALESEGVECHFKNIKIKELPSTNPKPEEIADVAAGYVSIFNGTDLTGWKTEKDAWKAGGGVLRAVGKAELVREKMLANGGVVLFDWKVPAKAAGEITLDAGGTPLTFKTDKPGAWQRSKVVLVPKAGGSSVAFKAAEGLEIMNVFAHELPAK